MGTRIAQGKKFLMAFYHPRAFYIKLNHPDFDIPEDGVLTLNGRSLAWFLHEFGHLIQDTCTFYGVHDFLNFRDTFEAVQTYVARSPDEVIIPMVHNLEGQLDLAWARTTEDFRKTANPEEIWAEGKIWSYRNHEIVDKRW